MVIERGLLVFHGRYQVAGSAAVGDEELALVHMLSVDDLAMAHAVAGSTGLCSQFALRNV